jgi:hypothetical protein
MPDSEPRPNVLRTLTEPPRASANARTIAHHQLSAVPNDPICTAAGLPQLHATAVHQADIVRRVTVPVHHRA